jgi:hypothetical protein
MRTTPYAQGKEAFKAGVSIQKNPYPSGSMDHSNWRTGWRIAEAWKTYTKTK